MKVMENLQTLRLENPVIIIEKEVKNIVADPAKFHFVADWLTDSKIIYVEKEGNGLIK